MFLRDTTNSVHCVAVDGCGNTNSCDFLVKVLRPSPSITSGPTPGTITVSWQAGTLQHALVPGDS